MDVVLAAKTIGTQKLTTKYVDVTAVATSNATSDAAIAYFDDSGSGGSGSTGTTFTLTTGVDTTITGGTGDDTYIADNTGADVTSTADALNGGDGTDTINIYSDGAAGALPALTSIEVANIYDQNATLTLTSNSWDSVTTVNEIRGDGSILNLGDKVTTVGLTDLVVAGIAGTTNDTVVAFDAALTSATLNLSGITAAGAAADENIALTGAALTTLTVNVTSDSTFDVLDAAAATSITLNATGALTTTVATTGTATLTITGAGAVDVGALDADINTVTATANTGGLTAAIGANVDTVLTGSAGNDTITAGTTDALVTADALAVNAGDGTGDILIVVEAADISSTADGARYTNFETLRVSASQAVSQVAGITALQLTGANTQTYSGLNATNAGNVQVRGNETSATFSLTTATGTTDALTLKMGTGTAATAATSLVTGVTVTGFETLNIQENGGATATSGANRTATIAAFTGATLNDINLTGRAVTLSNIATTVAVDIDGSALTGNGATISVGLTLAGSAVAGSSIHGSSVRDAYTIGAQGSTYDGGAGNDTFTTSSAILLADGVADGTIVGGLGTDTIILNAASTLTDLSFTNVTGVEALTLLGGAVNESVTGLAGSAKTAFADGITVTTATTLANDQTFTWASGIYDKAVTLTLVSDGVGNTTGDNISITTGSAADTISVTAGSWIGHATTGGVYAISTGAGADSITITSGTVLATGSISVTGGTGADTISATTLRADEDGDVAGAVIYNIASGDSTTTAYDVITGFDIGTAAKVSDSLNLDSTTVVANTAATDGTNSGTILSHSITSGIITFDDNNTFTTAVVVNATNLADVLAYLAANTSTNDTVAFTYDSDASGTADATFVYQNLASDVLVELVAVIGLSISATNESTAGLIDLN
jgi:hypothetical protein